MNSGGHKTIQLNPEFLIQAGLVLGLGLGGGTSSKKTLNTTKNKREKPKLFVNPTKMRKQLLTRIKDYQNKTEHEGLNNINNKKTAAEEEEEEAVQTVAEDDEKAKLDFNNEFNQSLSFLQDLSLQDKEKRINKKLNKTLKNKNIINNNININTELPPELAPILALKPVSAPILALKPVSAPKPVLALKPVSAPILALKPVLAPVKLALKPVLAALVQQAPVLAPVSAALVQQAPVLAPVSASALAHVPVPIALPYSNLKGGTKPTYRNWKNRSVKNMQALMQVKSGPVAQAPQIQGPVAQIQGPVAQIQGPMAQIQGPMPQIQGPMAQIQGPMPQIQGPMAQIQGPVAQAQIQGPDRIRKRVTKTMKYKLGKKGRIVSVLIKNLKTRKLVQHEHALLKQKNILDVKNYLRKKNLLKIGSDAPPDVLRQIYETAILTGDVENKAKEVLIHNYMHPDEK
jgi:hypothetical protein